MTTLHKTLKELRTATGLGVALCNEALIASNGDFVSALAYLEKKNGVKAAKLKDRVAGVSFIGMYRHHDGSKAAMVDLRCETDFVARHEDFKGLASLVAMQIVALNPETTEELLAQEFITEFVIGSGTKTVQETIDALSAKVGEKIKIEAWKIFG